MLNNNEVNKLYHSGFGATEHDTVHTPASHNDPGACHQCAGVLPRFCHNIILAARILEQFTCTALSHSAISRSCLSSFSVESVEIATEESWLSAGLQFILIKYPTKFLGLALSTINQA